MRSYLFALTAALALVGAGCASSATTSADLTVPPADVPAAAPSSGDQVVTTTQEIDAQVSDSKDGLTVNLGYKGTGTTTVSCSTPGCFDEKFAKCEPATLTAELEGLGTASYKIVGKSGAGCNVDFAYTKNINPKWVNQKMTCTLDTRETFQQTFQKQFELAFENKGTCKGPLVPLLQADE
jgi:hypothetical protein